ncbi:MAG: thioredoxin domain-containing protein [Sulfurovum sp.]|nr:thioredoxin domain-containing protein [Sulfurovaceae bacterium]
MSLMSKLLSSTIALTAILNAGMSESELTDFYKQFIVKNPAIEVVSTKIIEKQKIPDAKDWEVYLTKMNIEVKGEVEGKETIKKISVPQTVFSNGDLVTPVLMNKKTGHNYINDFKPSMSDSFYNKEHLIFGNKDAKHKIVIFSDPQCPFCQEIVPEIFKSVRRFPKTFALYYYHMPLLRIHPVSDILTRIMVVAQHKDDINAIVKLYSLKIAPNETNVDKVIAAVTKHSGFTVTKAEIDDKKIKDIIAGDEASAVEMMVTGTPTIYFDGKWDKNRNKYKSFMP